MLMRIGDELPRKFDLSALRCVGNGSSDPRNRYSRVKSFGNGKPVLWSISANWVGWR
jgi:hypothetical protein